MKAVRILLASALLVLPMAALSRAPFTFADGDSAWLRFSWRMRVTGDEDCRPRTQAELDELPVHMRTPTACTPVHADYLLLTQVDELRPDTLPLVRTGVKGDRPLFVMSERSLVPGRHRVRVGLYRVTAAAGTRELAALDRLLVFEPGSVLLVTLDAEARNFELRSGNTAEH